jgi:hypothetical protein
MGQDVQCGERFGEFEPLEAEHQSGGKDGEIKIKASQGGDAGH